MWKGPEEEGSKLTFEHRHSSSLRGQTLVGLFNLFRNGRFRLVLVFKPGGIHGAGLEELDIDMIEC